MATPSDIALGVKGPRTSIKSPTISLIAPEQVNRVMPGGSQIVGTSYANNSLPILVERLSYNIPQPLPYYLFCPDAISTNYATVIADANNGPQGGVLVVDVFQNKYLRLRWTVLGATDTILISTQFPVPYPVILSMIQSGDWFISMGFQQTVGSNYNAQFNGTSLSYGQMAFSGFKGSNAVPLSIFKSPFQFQNNIIAVNRMITMNTRRYLSMIMAASAPTPGDEFVINDFDISVYHSSCDFTGDVVSFEATDYAGGGH